jgi:hypothetical protein
MRADKVIEQAQAELFKSRTEPMCGAAVAESGGRGCAAVTG